jgi:peptidyl-prolyl cis-trans isomerase D
MSIIQTIRDRGSWIMVTLLVLALVSFIFMDSRNQDGLFSGNKEKTVGSVNGTKIKEGKYLSQVDALSYAYAGQNVQREQIEDAVWSLFEDENVMKAEYAPLYADFTDKNIEDYAIGQLGGPGDPFIIQFFKTTFGQDPELIQETQNGGALNPKKAELYLKNIKAQSAANPEVQKIMNYYTSLLQLIKVKYAQQRFANISTTANYTPQWFAAKKRKDDSQIVGLSYVQYPYSEVNDTTVAEVKVSDKEIDAYTSKHALRYKVGETRDIDYTLFSYQPIAADSTRVLADVMSKREKLASTTDSAMPLFIKNTNSLIPYQSQYKKKSELLQFIDSTTVLSESAMVGPYVKNGSYVLGRVMAVKNFADSASARHILVSIGGEKGRSQADAKKLIDSVASLYAKGVTFDSLAKTFSEDPGSKDSGGLYKNIGLNQMVPEFNDYVFSNSAGATGIVKTSFGYHFIRAEGTRGKMNQVYKVAFISKLIAPSEDTKNSVQSAALTFSSTNNTAKQFDDYLAKNTQQIKSPAMGIQKNDPKSVPGLNERSKDLMKWIFTSKEGKISGPIDLPNTQQFIVAKLVKIHPEGLQSAADIRKNDISTMNTLVNAKKYDYLAKKYASVTSIDDAAAKTGKVVMKADSVAFGGFIPNIPNDVRALGYAFGKDAVKVSGPIKGETGLIFVQANSAATAKPVSGDLKQVQRNMEQNMAQQTQKLVETYKKKASIKNNRAEYGY